MGVGEVVFTAVDMDLMALGIDDEGAGLDEASDLLAADEAT